MQIHTLVPFFIGLPAAASKRDESPEQTVRRELLEELGINLTNVEPLGAADHI